MIAPPHRLLVGLMLSACLLAVRPSRADIVMGNFNSDGTNSGPGNNTGPDPYGLSNYEGQLNVGIGFLATPISSQYLVTAAHIGDAGGNPTNFSIGGKTYSVAQVATSGDLAVWQIVPSSNQHFDPLNIAPLFTSGNETGQALYDYGQGLARGAGVYAADNKTLQGWSWGGAVGAKTWGDGVVSSVQGDLLTWDFDKNLHDPNTSILTLGDSGGGAFIKHNGVWQLAGINYGFTGAYTKDNAGNFNLQPYSLFDLNGYYIQTDTNTYQLVTDHSAMQSAATAISSHLGFLSSYASVPEPSGLALIGIGLGGSLLARRRLRRPA